jgi:integrase
MVAVVSALWENESHGLGDPAAGNGSVDGLYLDQDKVTVTQGRRANPRCANELMLSAQGAWTPREMRHSFVSLLSDSGVPIESIARLVGHAGGSAVTETAYRKQIRPVLLEGAEAMDRIFTTPTPGPTGPSA